jgi:hypothetical protein
MTMLPQNKNNRLFGLLLVLALPVLAQGCGQTFAPPAAPDTTAVTPPAPAPAPATQAVRSVPKDASMVSSSARSIRPAPAQETSVPDVDLKSLEILRGLRDSWTVKGPKIPRESSNHTTASHY